MFERRRIEEALHDGVQQDLVAASVTIQLALQLLDGDPAAARALLQELEHHVAGSLERVRTLAHEIYPSLLQARGLGDALRARGIEAGSLGRYALEIEEAVYFACRALDTGATRIRVRDEGGAIRVDADGRFEEEAVAYARRRVAAVGGQLAASPGGAGVMATVPASSAR
ncbi:MAG: sensor histidine kinase [Gaiellaceae bacterium]